ncbi:MAG: hypothetical protein JWM90_3036 [Thermoleophilia bacterium]|nr:hypothetical protein [Thermoleophilia bacterium]
MGRGLPMDIALSVLLLWGLLFVPIGLVLHWLVLGDGACVRALPIAPVTGVATAFLVLATLGRMGYDAGESWVPWVFVVATLGSVLAIWRLAIPWRSRELIGSTMLVLFAMLLIQLPVFGDHGEGPLGYGTAANPVEEVAAIDAAAKGPAGDLEVARDAAATASDRPIGFEQFAALTVAIGGGDAGDDADVEWSGYGLHSVISGLLALFTTLPLFAFARARGVGTLGLIVLVPLGVLTPYAFLAVANGAGAAVASIPFLIAGAFSLLVTRRDRGWWALAVLFGAAAVSTAGALALLPLVTTGLAWMFLRTHTYEHLSQHDAPVPRWRTLIVTAAAAILGATSIITTLGSGSGSLLAWPRLHDNLLDAVRSWPFTWLDTDLSTAGPAGTLETLFWLIGPVLLLVAGIEAVIRNERRELGVMAGAIVAFAVGLAVAFVDRSAGIRLIEFVLLACSPLLASLAVRGVSLARETSEGVDTPVRRIARVFPALVVVSFVVLSLSATAVTGSRMVHAPQLAEVEAASSKQGATLIAAGDPWLAFVIDGERARGGYADADELAGVDPSRSRESISGEAYSQLILPGSPLASDPPVSYVEQSTFDAYQARGFLNRSKDAKVTRDTAVDIEQLRQAALSATSSSPERVAADESAAEGDTDPAADTSGPRRTADLRTARQHTPVETSRVPADRPAGRLLPADDVPDCSAKADVTDVAPPCDPDEPRLGEGCTPADVAAVRSPIDVDASATRAGEPAVDTQLLHIDSDPTQQEKPPLLGVQCFEVDLQSASSVLLVHLRDVGLVLAPEDATSLGTSGAWSRENEEGRSGGSGGVAGGVRRVTNERDASLTFGASRLFGEFEVVVEGSFGAGVGIAAPSSLGPVDPDRDGADNDPPVPIEELRGSADGFSRIVRSVRLEGSLAVTNSSGTDIEVGRVFARPRDIPRSCNVPLPIEAGERREVRLESTGGASTEKIVRPGLSAAVVRVNEDGANRRVRVAVGTYLTNHGLPRYTLVDWTEQYDGPLEVDGCDGLVHREQGALDLQDLESFGRERDIEITSK